MAQKGVGFFDSKGHFFKTPEDATVSDIAALLGKVGDGESLASGIANLLFERREDLERLFADHDRMMADYQKLLDAPGEEADNVARLADRRGEVA